MRKYQKKRSGPDPFLPFLFLSNSRPLSPQVEHETISAFLELVVKLNETTFKPLFRKLYDWAFTKESGTETQLF